MNFSPVVKSGVLQNITLTNAEFGNYPLSKRSFDTN